MPDQLINSLTYQLLRYGFHGKYRFEEVAPANQLP